MRNPLITLLAFLLVLTTLVYNQVPRKISYQGVLTKPSGAPVQNGSYTLRFALYDSLTGGTSFWNETHAGVQVDRGVFSVILGSITSLNIAFDRQFFVEVAALSGPGTGFPTTFSPRSELTSAPYSLRADTANVALQLSAGIPSGAIIMWSGPLSSIPVGWKLCDGTNGTPDLRDRFIQGVATGEDPGIAGGSVDHSHSTSSSMGGSHYHIISRGVGGGGFVESGEFGTVHTNAQTEFQQGFDGTYDNGSSGYEAFKTSTASDHDHTFNTDSSSHLPPYYKLAFIMKL